MSRKATTRELIKERYTRNKVSLMTSYEIADELGKSQTAVWNALHKLRWVTQGIVKGKRKQTILTCKKVVEYIKTHGGYVNQALTELKISLSESVVHEYARDIGINLSNYRYKGQRYGNWLVLSGPIKAAYTRDFRVPALCTSCGKQEYKTLINLKAGLSNACAECASKTRNYSQVKCQETGETFRSLRKAVSHYGSLANYQRIRVTLKNEGAIEINGVTLVYC